MTDYSLANDSLFTAEPKQDTNRQIVKDAMRLSFDILNGNINPIPITSSDHVCDLLLCLRQLSSCVDFVALAGNGQELHKQLAVETNLRQMLKMAKQDIMLRNCKANWQLTRREADNCLDILTLAEDVLNGNEKAVSNLLGCRYFLSVTINSCSGDVETKRYIPILYNEQMENSDLFAMAGDQIRKARGRSVNFLSAALANILTKLSIDQYWLSADYQTVEAARFLLWISDMAEMKVLTNLNDMLRWQLGITVSMNIVVMTVCSPAGN